MMRNLYKPPVFCTIFKSIELKDYLSKKIWLYYYVFNERSLKKLWGRDCVQIKGKQMLPLHLCVAAVDACPSHNELIRSLFEIRRC